MVRLKGGRPTRAPGTPPISIPHGTIKRIPMLGNLNTPSRISIPHGTIKRHPHGSHEEPRILFQFHMVRLKDKSGKRTTRGAVISIPHGTIKRAEGGTPRAVFLYFNSTWYD